MSRKIKRIRTGGQSGVDRAALDVARALNIEICGWCPRGGWAEDYVLLFDKNKDFMRAMNVSMVPHVFVLDGKGKIVYSHTSYAPGSELELLEAIKKCSK